VFLLLVNFPSIRISKPNKYSGGRNITIRIMMAYREVNEDLRQTLLLDPSVHLEINALRTGDFLINDLLLVERKTFRDFVSSIKDGRIFKQAVRLASNSKPNLIILEELRRTSNQAG
jgi:ERCC4-type nuclease